MNLMNLNWIQMSCSGNYMMILSWNSMSFLNCLTGCFQMKNLDLTLNLNSKNFLSCLTGLIHWNCSGNSLNCCSQNYLSLMMMNWEKMGMKNWMNLDFLQKTNLKNFHWKMSWTKNYLMSFHLSYCNCFGYLMTDLTLNLSLRKTQRSLTDCSQNWSFQKSLIHWNWSLMKILNYCLSYFQMNCSMKTHWNLIGCSQNLMTVKILNLKIGCSQNLNSGSFLRSLIMSFPMSCLNLI